MAEILLEGISKRYPDGTQALKRTDLRVHDGELFILVGPSGCGKSTLLKLIVGLERPSTGEVRVGGEAVTARDPKDRNMAMVFQSYALYPHMSVRENLAFPLKLARMGKTDIAAQVARAAEILELEPLLERRPAALSGGQRQRVAMGRALVREPVAFLLDEPLSNLDAKLRVQMRAELARLQRRLGTTMVYVTHDQTEAMTLGERIAVLHDGTVQQVGTPRELYRRPRNLFVASFLGSPPINLVPAAVGAGHLQLPITELALPDGLSQRLPTDAEELLLGIRPEHLVAEPRPGNSASPAGTFRAEVELVEWLGADLHVHVGVAAAGPTSLMRRRPGLGRGSQQDGRLRLIARLGSDTPVAEGDRLDLRIDPAAALFFDPASGARIPTEDACGDPQAGPP